ncbi:MAG: radical SAM protein [Candidatus Omnitrophota bacterium]
MHQVYVKKKNIKPYLGTLTIELTERCNNNCTHCCINLPEQDLEAKRKELSTDKIKSIIEEALILGCRKIWFTGGEPLLREDFEDIYIFTRKLGLRVLLFTNAMLITPRIIDVFKKYPPNEKIEVTVYGLTKQSYESSTRVPGSFEKFNQGTNLLKENNIPFVIKTALLPGNKHEMGKIRSFSDSLPATELGLHYSLHFDLRGRRDDEKKNNMIKQLRISSRDSLEVLAKNRDAYIKEKKLYCNRFNGLKGDRLFSCGAGMQGATLDAYGNLQPCVLLRHPDTVYDIKKGTLKEGLKKMLYEVRNIRAANPDYLSRCAKCFIKVLCEQCPGKSWGEHGTLDTPVEYLCSLAHGSARFLGLLKDNERAWEIEDGIERMERFTGKKIKEVESVNKS